MSKIPDNLKYSQADEWVMVEGDLAIIGITDYAQDALNDIVYLELPEVGATVTVEEEFGVVESVKAASDLIAPVSGEVTASNEDLVAEPEIINTDPYDKGWMIKVKMSDTAELDSLMDAAAYAAYLETR